MDLTKFDLIVINSSGGKDSVAMLHKVAHLAQLQGVSSRCLVVHCDLGEAEWPGTLELAKRQADRYGLRFETVARAQGLFDQVEQRGMWPSSKARYCTSDHKRDQVAKAITGWVKELGLSRQARVLNCIGIRAQESNARAKLEELVPNVRASSGRREITTWHPILDWSEASVWRFSELHNLEQHPAYAMGMPRLSCCFCVFASKKELVISGKANPALLAKLVGLEARIGHTFKANLSLAEVAEEVAL